MRLLQGLDVRTYYMVAIVHEDLSCIHDVIQHENLNQGSPSNGQQREGLVLDSRRTPIPPCYRWMLALKLKDTGSGSIVQWFFNFLNVLASLVGDNQYLHNLHACQGHKRHVVIDLGLGVSGVVKSAGNLQEFILWLFCLLLYHYLRRFDQEHHFLD